MSESQPVRAAKTGPSAGFGCFPAAAVMKVALLSVWQVET